MCLEMDYKSFTVKGLLLTVIGQRIVLILTTGKYSQFLIIYVNGGEIVAWIIQYGVQKSPYGDYIKLL